MPSVPPGEYTLSLNVDGRVTESKTAVLADPRIDVPADVFAAQIEGISRSSTQLARLAQAVTALRSLRDKIPKIQEAAGKAGEKAAGLSPALAGFKARVDALADEVLPKDFIGLGSREQMLRGGTPFQKLTAFSINLANSAEPPTAVELRQIAELEKVTGDQVDRLNALLRTDVPPLNESLKKAGLAVSLRVPAEIK